MVPELVRLPDYVGCAMRIDQLQKNQLHWLFHITVGLNSAEEPAVSAVQPKQLQWPLCSYAMEC